MPVAKKPAGKVGGKKEASFKRPAGKLGCKKKEASSKEPDKKEAEGGKLGGKKEAYSKGKAGLVTQPEEIMVALFEEFRAQAETEGMILKEMVESNGGMQALYNEFKEKFQAMAEDATSRFMRSNVVALAWSQDRFDIAWSLARTSPMHFPGAGARVGSSTDVAAADDADTLDEEPLVVAGAGGGSSTDLVAADDGSRWRPRETRNYRAQIEKDIDEIRNSCERYQVFAQSWFVKVGSATWNKYTHKFCELIERFVLDIAMFLSQDPTLLNIADVHDWHCRIADGYASLEVDAQWFVEQGLMSENDIDLASPAKRRRLRGKTAFIGWFPVE